jgi:hypothetical protein
VNANGVAPSNNVMHPTADTTALINLNLVGGRVMPGVINTFPGARVGVRLTPHAYGSALANLPTPSGASYCAENL